jgi:hypothetical protein
MLHRPIIINNWSREDLVTHHSQEITTDGIARVGQMNNDWA